MKLGKHIAKSRQKRGLTQKQLAWEVGISERYLRKIESGRIRPHIKTIARLARCLDVELGKLLEE
ncbi:MAG: helix-turn-helix domain-containing protein [Desulfitobacteriaceae bacterium]